MSTLGVIREIWRYPFKSMQGERLERCEVGTTGLPGDRGWAVRDETAGEIRGAKKMPALLLCTARYREEPAGGRIPPVDITLPDGTTVASDAPGAAARLSEVLGRRVTVWPLLAASDREHYRRGQPDNPDMMAELRQIFAREDGEPLPDLSVFPQELFEFTSLPGTYFDALPIHLLTTASLATMAEQNPRAAWDVRRFRPNFVIETAPETGGLAEEAWCGKTLRLGTLELRCEMTTARCGMTTQPQEGLPKDPSVLRTIVASAGQNLGAYANIARPGRVAVGDPVTLMT
jgi:uncharacterized protein YcbX